VTVTADQSSEPTSSYLHDILSTPEQPALLRLTSLVAHLFKVSVSYMGLLGNGNRVVARIGSGTEYSQYLKTYPLDRVLVAPVVIQDAANGLPPGAEFGDLRFVASAPLRASSGTCLGALVIADTEPKADFSDRDTQNLAELAGVLAGKMELRMIASQALESELSLRETERQFRAIANCAPALIYYCDVDGAFSFVNTTWLEFTGRKLEEELGDGWADSVHPDYRQQVVEGFWQALTARQPFVAEAPMRRHDGQYRWMLGRGAPRLGEDGGFAGYVGTITDVTEHYHALAALRLQSQCTAAVAEAAGAFYLVLDPDGRIEQVSPLCQRTSKRDPAEMIGHFVWETCDAARSGAAAIQETVRRAASERAVVQTQTLFSPREGGVSELLWTFTPIPSERGELGAVVATVVEARGGTWSTAACDRVRCACSRT